MIWWVAGPLRRSADKLKAREALSLARSTAVTTATPSAMPAMASTDSIQWRRWYLIPARSKEMFKAQAFPAQAGRSPA